jgi:uncharacterized protein (DUF486 family)
MQTILLLTVSNIFMTMLPGAGESDRLLPIQRGQLKTIQEVTALVVFFVLGALSE